jgi:5-hydroxyisourate hydrolase-like protein (transthyretin family)
VPEKVTFFGTGPESERKKNTFSKSVAIVRPGTARNVTVNLFKMQVEQITFLKTVRTNLDSI